MIILKELKDDSINYLKEANLNPIPPVFILSGEIEYVNRWDFPELQQKIIESLPSAKKNTIVLSLHGYANDLVNAKYKTLKKKTGLLCSCFCYWSFTSCSWFIFWN